MDPCRKKHTMHNLLNRLPASTPELGLGDLLLDSGPLGLVTQPRLSPEVVAVNRWLIDCLASGDAVLVPAIIYYELRRELLRARKASGLARLDAFVEIDPNRYLALTDEALRLALPPRRSFSAAEPRSSSSPAMPAISASSWTHALGMTPLPYPDSLRSCAHTRR
jgi:hypothetical protein